MSKQHAKILMSAYACEPGRGSEPWVGWNWCLQMAELHDVTVVTRANNRELIEAALEDRPVPVPEFLYYDLPRPFIALKKRGILPATLYYILWQIGMTKKLRKAVRQFDLVHHITFNSFVLAGFWWLMKTKTILGPLGGGMITRRDYLPLFRGKKLAERLRSLFVRTAVFFPPTYLGLRRASYVLCANQDTLERLPRALRGRSGLLLETALDLSGSDGDKDQERAPCEKAGDVVALWVGSLEPRKGLELGLRALAQVEGVRLEIIGAGPQRDYLEKLGHELGLGDRVTWHGRLPHGEIRPAMARSDLFLFTSVRDTSGNVVLEAMSTGVPVVAINHQGVAEILDPDCAMLVPPGAIEATVDGFAAAMQSLASDPALRQRLGENGRKKLADQFSWRKNRDAMDEIYRRVMGEET